MQHQLVNVYSLEFVAYAEVPLDGPVLLDVAELALVSGGSPKGGWELDIAQETDPSPKGGW